MNNWVPLALEPTTDTWICGRDDGYLLTVTSGFVEDKTVDIRDKPIGEFLRSREVSPSVEYINSTRHGRFPLEVMGIGNYAIKAVYCEEIKTWFVVQGSVTYHPDPRSMEEIALEINESLRQLEEQSHG